MAQETVAAGRAMSPAKSHPCLIQAAAAFRCPFGRKSMAGMAGFEPAPHSFGDRQATITTHTRKSGATPVKDDFAEDFHN